MRTAAPLTGWILFAVFLILAAFNGRKRLSMLPLARARTWLLVHVIGGLLAVAIFWLHAQTLWPRGFYEKALAGFFYAVSVSGVIGYALQRVYPRLLAGTGVEVIYERIPAELAQLRERAEALMLTCTKETGSDTLARHYIERLDWYFRRPRFFLRHAFGGEQAKVWQRRQCGAVRRYLSPAEATYLDQLTALAQRKTDMDFHYAAQSIMKGWLFVHIPMASAILALVVWHIVVVHVYAL